MRILPQHRAIPSRALATLALVVQNQLVRFRE